MSLRHTLDQIAQHLKAEFSFYRRVYAHPETPLRAKLLLWLAIGYVLLPFDLIPDFIPVIGQLDDMVLVPLLLYLGMKAVPAHVIEICRKQAT